MDRAHIAGQDRSPLDSTLSRRVGLALQINLHPRQAALAEEVLPHQLAVWAPLVDRVVLTIDNRPERGCRGEAYRQARKRLFLLLDALREVHPGLGIDGVVYADHFRQKVAAGFFGGALAWPDHAHDGSPFYGVFFGLMRANAHLVLHLAPDAPDPGGVGWLMAARARLAEENGFLAAGGCVLLDMDRLAGLAPLAPVRPPLLAQMRARLRGREAASLPALAVIALRAGLGIAGEAGAVPAATPRREKGRRLRPATLLERP